MSRFRLISRLDIKSPYLIKGIHLEGLRKIGDPNVFSRRYYEQGIDEILYMDAVASLYQRNSLFDIVEKTTRDVFVPITVGGGIRSIDDVRQALRAGADKVAINTAAVRAPELIPELAEVFGSQCIVLSVQAKRWPGLTGWEAMTDCGREHTGKDAVKWAMEATALGAGEVLVTSIDQEGTRKGFDTELVAAITAGVHVPVIASGGMGAKSHVVDLVNAARPSGVAIASVFHYTQMQPDELREELKTCGIDVRDVGV
jgi:cyclase